MSQAPKNKILQGSQKEVYCLFGLPVDNLTLESTKRILRATASHQNSLVLSTINVNWVVQSLNDRKFRDTILNSDIIVLDGKPLLWFAKFLGYPMQETVPGSTLIEELHIQKAQKPLSLFLFGGEEDTAELAMSRINQNQGGLRAVGSLNPGFGTVEEMSTEAIIATINKTKPDILLVALGAKKGSQWIEYNRHQLSAKVISHLGATINFMAGTVKRAPHFIGNIGLEWLWRIGQEPKLFSRYALDGLVILRLLASHFFIWLQFFFWQRKFRQEQPDEKINRQEYSDKTILSFGRNIQLTKNSPMRQVFDDCVRSGTNIVLDFQKTEYIDGAFMGLLLLFEKDLQNNSNNLTFININDRLTKIFDLFCFQKKK